MIPEYPKIIPELILKGSNQLKVNKLSLKNRIISLISHKRIIQDNFIYIKKRFSNKLHFMPLFTMTMALAYYNDFLRTHNEKYLDLFKTVAQKLLRISQPYGWKHDNISQLPGYPPKINSYSCLISGRGLGVIIRYYQLNKNKDLLKKIDKILDSFEIQSDDGGLLKPTGHFLEYSWGNKSPVVWNGYMSALVGLYDCFLYGPKQTKAKAKRIFDKSIRILENDLDKLIYYTKNFK